MLIEKRVGNFYIIYGHQQSLHQIFCFSTFSVSVFVQLILHTVFKCAVGSRENDVFKHLSVP